MIKTVVAFDWIMWGTGGRTAVENTKHFTRFLPCRSGFFFFFIDHIRKPRVLKASCRSELALCDTFSLFSSLSSAVSDYLMYSVLTILP